MIWLNGDIKIPCQFRCVKGFIHGLATVQLLDSRWAIIDKEGNFKKVLGPGYDAPSYDDGLLIVRVGDFSHFLDISSGRELLSPYRHAFGFYEGLCAVCLQDSGWGFINKMGTLIFRTSPPKMEDSLWNTVDSFSEGLASVFEDGKLGYISRAGKLVIPHQFKKAHSFSEGLAVVNKPKGPCECIDKNGGVKLTPGKTYTTSLDTGYETIFIVANSKEELCEKKIAVLEQVKLGFMRRIENQINASLSDIMYDIYDESTKSDVKEYRKSKEI